MSNQSQVDEHAEGQEYEHAQHVKLIVAEQIDELWNASDPLTHLFELYTGYFNPEHDHEYDVVDDNTIRFLAEFQIYNLIFCKNDLKLDNNQTAEVLDLLWCLLAVNQDGTLQDHSIPVEDNFQEALTARFAELRDSLIELAKAGILSKDQIKSIMAYMKTGYFKHLRLVDFVLRNRQMPALKQITLFNDLPLTQPSLDNAKEILDEVPHNHEEGEGERLDDDIDPNRDPLEDIDTRLAQTELDENSKQQVKARLQEYNQEVKEKIEKEMANKKK